MRYIVNNKTASFLFAAMLLFACKQKDKNTDPNKAIDEGSVKGETYVSKDIGWTIQIPRGWTVVGRDQMEANESKGKEALRKATHENVDMTDLKHLISFQKNKLNMFLSTIEPFPEDNPRVFEENFRATAKVIYDAYLTQGIQSDTATSEEVVHGHKYYVFHAKLYTPQRKQFMEQLIYLRPIRKKDFAVTMSYDNEGDKKVMMDAFRSSTFTED